MFDACNTAVSADLPFPGTELFLDGSVEGIVHKGRFSRTGDAGYTDHFTQREFYIDALQVMFGGTLNTDHMPVPFPPFLRKDRKSTRLNSSHVAISYAVFCF